MSSFETGVDESVGSSETSIESWTPPSGVAHHAGIPLDPSLDFFAPPPTEIGDVISAATTLKATKRPMPLGSRLLLCGFVSSLGVAILYATPYNIPILEFLLAAALGGLSWFCTRYRHECSYVGKLGTARIYCKGQRSQVSKPDLFLFVEAIELRTSQTRHYYNGAYTGTSYSFVWTDGDGATSYKLSGKYNGENKPPKPKSPFHFAQAAEIAWTGFLFDRAQDELNKTGAIRFNLGGSDWIAVGSGYLDLFIKGKEARCTSAEIAGITIRGGVFEVKRTDAKIGWFSKSGVFQFTYGNMANARLFLVALHKLLGYQFT